MGRLSQYLKKDDIKLSVKGVKADAQRIWSTPKHISYTDHSVSHSERIIRLLDGMTSSMMKDSKYRLSEMEIYILLTAAYLHDIGMQNTVYAKGNLEVTREQHHEQTYEMICQYKEYNIRLLQDSTIVEAVAIVAKGHRKVNLFGADYADDYYSAQKLRLGLLAALLRIGDALDIDHNRVIMDNIKITPLSAESKLHWWKCHYVASVMIENENINIAYRFPKPKPMEPDYNTIIPPLVEGDIRAELASIDEILRRGSVKLALLPPTFRHLDIEPLPEDCLELARKKIGSQPPFLKEFWDQFAIILSFAKIVHTGFQGLLFSSLEPLKEQAELVAHDPINEEQVIRLRQNWQNFRKYYDQYIVEELSGATHKNGDWFVKINDAFQNLRIMASGMKKDIETFSPAVEKALGNYEEVKKMLEGYPSLVEDLEEVIDGPTSGTASQIDIYKLRIKLMDSLAEEDLNKLCSEIISPQKNSEINREEKVKALIQQYQAQNKLLDFINLINDHGKKEDWGALFTTPYEKQLATKISILRVNTISLGLCADGLIQNLVGTIIPK
jgi:hypothetical protein